MKRVLLFLFLSIIAVDGVQAQLSFTPAITTYYNDNIYRSPEKLTDYIIIGSLETAYLFNNLPLNVSYTPQYTQYREQTQQNFWLHSVQLSYYPYLDEQNRYQLFLGASYDLRKNNPELNIYDYQQFNFKSSLFGDFETFFTTFSYRFVNRSFPENPLWDNRAHFLTLVVNKPFSRWRGSLIFRSQLATRSYNGSTRYVNVYDTLQTGGHGRRWHGGGMRVEQRTVEQSQPGVSMNQLRLSLRIAKSLRKNMGIYVQYLKTFDLSSRGTFQNSGSYFEDEELFDDPLSYTTDQLSSQLTVILPAEIQLRFGASTAQKRYVQEKAFISESDTVASGDLRSDTKSMFFVTAEKSISLSTEKERSLNIYLNLYYLHNRSNSYWYNYQNIFGSVGLEFILN